MQKPYLEAGKIVNTHGVRGEVRIQPWADDAAFLLGFRTFYIDGAPVPVAHSRVHKGMLVVKFQGVDDVNAAMTLKNRVVSIARADVTLPDGQYFQQDLLGIAVETDTGETLGTLREILDLPRGSVYVVQGDREVLIPDRPEFVRSIDPAAGRMVVHRHSHPLSRHDARHARREHPRPGAGARPARYPLPPDPRLYRKPAKAG